MGPCLHHLFEQHASTKPRSIAVRHRGDSLSYAELNRRADVLAAHLRAAGVGRGAIVALMLERSHKAVAALLGILKAGAAYVPIDPGYPADWQAAILGDSRPVVRVGTPSGAGGAALPTIDDGWWDDPAALAGAPADAAGGVMPDDLMYVIYTSGSTGKPKGVRVSHANVNRLFPAVGRHLRFDADDVWSQFHSPAFGFSVWEIWGALAHGGRLVIVPPELTMAPRRLLDHLAREKVSVLSQTPTAFRQLCRSLGESPSQVALPDLRVVAFSGEPLENHVVAPWLRHFGDQRPQLVNLYALTETAGEIAFHRVTRQTLASEHAGLIGVALPDVTLHLLDAAGAPIGDEQVGELHVGGPCVALGYLNQPDLTAERFPVLDLGGAPQRVYRTGDLARRLATGEYQFVGRADRQVKVRGYRVEPGDVEAVLCGHADIDDAVVLPEPDADGETRLVAFLLSRATLPASQVLRSYLASRLPHYAIPSRFETVDGLPMTPNGKLDLAALRQRARPVAAAEGEAAALDGGLSVGQQVAAIWCELLELPAVEPGDDFFDLGGHSLMTLSLVMLLEQRLGVEVTMTDVFEAPTLAQLSEVVDRRRHGEGAMPARAAGAVADAATRAEAEHGVYMRQAIAKAREAMAQGQPPYAACIVHEGRLVAAVHNVIWQNTDATAHAEVEAIRLACRRLGTIDLSGCVLYSTAEPCSMCLTASVWAKVGTIVYAVDMADEARFGLSAQTVPCRTMLDLLQHPLTLVAGVHRGEMRQVFEDWLRIKALEA